RGDRQPRMPGAPSEVLEGVGLAGHAEAQARHEHQVGVRATGDQPIAVERGQGRLSLAVQPELRHGGAGVFHVAGAEGVVGLQPEQAEVERVRRRRWEEVVALHRVTSPDKLPWAGPRSEQRPKAEGRPIYAGSRRPQAYALVRRGSATTPKAEGHPNDDAMRS